MTEAAFNAFTGVLNALRPQLRSATPAEFLVHPAYNGESFPIHWQGQNAFLEAPRPPAYVRFSHHAIRPTFGHSMISCFARGSETNVEAIRDVILAAYPIGAYEGVTLKSVDHKPAFAPRGVFHLPIHLHWTVPS